MDAALNKFPAAGNGMKPIRLENGHFHVLEDEMLKIEGKYEARRK